MCGLHPLILGVLLRGQWVDEPMPGWEPAPESPHDPAGLSPHL